jgi:hypothetical protein
MLNAIRYICHFWPSYSDFWKYGSVGIESKYKKNMEIDLCTIKAEAMFNVLWWYIRSSMCMNQEIEIKHLEVSDLCGPVVRVPGYRSRGPGSIHGTTRFSDK